MAETEATKRRAPVKRAEIVDEIGLDRGVVRQSKAILARSLIERQGFAVQKGTLLAK